MHCYVYKSLLKSDTYLYVKEKDVFTALPAELLESLGRMKRVLDLDLVAGRKLARADAEAVKADLVRVGYYLQSPLRPDRAPIEATF